MKLKSSFEHQGLTQEQIDWLNQVVDGTWEYENGEINVIGDVNMNNDDLNSIPIQFGYVTGYLDCGHASISSLKGSPRDVGDSFYCSNTEITSLQYAPREIGGDFVCSDTNITSLQYAPREVGRDFWCPRTKITSLEHAPCEVGRNFYCYNANIKGEPDTSHIQIGGELYWK